MKFHENTIVTIYGYPNKKPLLSKEEISNITGVLSPEYKGKHPIIAKNNRKKVVALRSVQVVSGASIDRDWMYQLEPSSTYCSNHEGRILLGSK